MKTVLSFMVILFWISSWFPSAPDRWSIIVATVSICGLIAAHLARKVIGNRVWPAKVASVFAVIALIGGILLVLLRLPERTSVDAGITFFFVLGGVGYLLLLRSIMDPRESTILRRGMGVMLLSVLAIWSWGSAVRMYSHFGADRYISDACILVPNPSEYDSELTSIWDMRLSLVAASRVRPSGSYLWEYHAILVAQVDGGVQQYNWSKKWMRFELLDPVRSPYLPKKCP
jgi:hypothetical protein